MILVIPLECFTQNDAAPKLTVWLSSLMSVAYLPRVTLLQNLRYFLIVCSMVAYLPRATLLQNLPCFHIG